MTRMGKRRGNIIDTTQTCALQFHCLIRVIRGCPRMPELIHEELSGAIIGIAMEILNELKPGLDEVLYERAMVIELRRRGHDLCVQQSFPVFYQSELIGTLIPDLIVDQTIIVDPKVVSAFTETH